MDLNKLQEIVQREHIGAIIQNKDGLMIVGFENGYKASIIDERMDRLALQGGGLELAVKDEFDNILYDTPITFDVNSYWGNEGADEIIEDIKKIASYSPRQTLEYPEINTTALITKVTKESQGIDKNSRYDIALYVSNRDDGQEYKIQVLDNDDTFIYNIKKKEGTEWKTIDTFGEPAESLIKEIQNGVKVNQEIDLDKFDEAFELIIDEYSHNELSDKEYFHHDNDIDDEPQEYAELYTDLTEDEDTYFSERLANAKEKRDALGLDRNNTGGNPFGDSQAAKNAFGDGKPKTDNQTQRLERM